MSMLVVIQERWIFGAAAIMSLAICACGENTTSPTEPPAEETEPADPPITAEVSAYQVRGTAMSGSLQNILVTTDRGIAVPNAVITVNGEAIPVYDAQRGHYHARMENVVAAGGSLDLQVSIDDKRIEAVGTVPHRAVITAPTGEGQHSLGEAIQVTWDSETDPDRFLVQGTFSCGENCGTFKQFEVSGDARTFAIPGGTFPDETLVTFVVSAYNDGSWSGAFVEGSQMNVWAASWEKPTLQMIP